jgi:hypothetical protein
VYYDGNMGVKKSTPVTGDLVAGLDYKLSYNLLNGIFIWNTSPKWTLATSVGVPIQNTHLAAYKNDNKTEDSSTKIGDVVFAPIIANYHINPTTHVLFGVNIFAPTGSYNTDNMSNASLNNWTFVPNMAATKIFPSINTEISTNLGYEIYTKNKDTNYQNGDLLRFDLLGLKRFKSGLGVGGVYGLLYQTTDDDSKYSKQLNGFKGQAQGIGPIISYEKKFANKTSLTTSIRGVHEFDVKNRPEGDAYQFNLTWQY